MGADPEPKNYPDQVRKEIPSGQNIEGFRMTELEHYRGHFL